jgi:hypothetical protein
MDLKIRIYANYTNKLGGIWTLVKKRFKNQRLIWYRIWKAEGWHQAYLRIFTRKKKIIILIKKNFLINVIRGRYYL